MMHSEKTHKGQAKPVVLVLVAAVFGAVSAVALLKWQHAKVEAPPAGLSTPQSPAAQSAPSPVAQVAPVPAAPTVAPSPPPPKPSDMETLVGPIALYPDPLLTQILPASTYPLEVVQAARWLQSKPDLALASQQDWAPSIIVLLQFPQVIYMMNDQLDWTTQLGDRFLAEPEAVLGAIQTLRGRAMAAGLLKDTPQQKVAKASVTKVSSNTAPSAGGWATAPAATSESQTPQAVQTKQTEVIRIEPANPQVVYVPQYNPQTLYAAPAYYPASAPTYNSQPTTTSSETSPWLTFGVGVATGALLGWAISEWSDDDWDDDYHGYYHYPPIAHYGGGNYYGYGGNNVNVNRNVNISGNEVNVNRRSALDRPVPTPWIHEPRHRRGYRYTSQAQARLKLAQQQPALAGQRLGAGQAANLDYAGYDREQLDRARQNQVQKALGQSGAFTPQQRAKTLPQPTVQPLKPATQKPLATRQATSGRAVAETQRKPAADMQKRNIQTRPAAQPAERQTLSKTLGSISDNSRFAAARSRPSSERAVADNKGAFGGLRDGGQAQTFSRRGQESRASAMATAGGRNVGSRSGAGAGLRRR